VIELRALERYARRATDKHAAATCELCSVAIDTEHRHVVDTVDRKLKCTCRACALVFDHDEGRLRAVPTDVRLAAEPFDAAQRAALKVPVGLAFFLKSSALGRWFAIFPSPAGATEAELDDASARVLDESAFARTAREDVEAVLVRTHKDGLCECFITPVDICYECVASLRMHWKGIAGGDEAHRAIDAIIERLRERGQS
jgi:hypothetical protein